MNKRGEINVCPSFSLKSYGREYFEERGFSFEKDYARFWPLAVAIFQFGARRVLDIGAAYGALVKALLDVGVDAYGVDVSEYAVSSSPVKNRLILVDVATQNLPYSREMFDFVTAINVLEHLPNLDHSLREINRVLRYGGFLYISVPSEKTVDTWLDPYHVNILRREEWGDLLVKYGFRKASASERTRFWYYFFRTKLNEKVVIPTQRSNTNKRNIFQMFLIWQRSAYRFLMVKTENAVPC